MFEAHFMSPKVLLNKKMEVQHAKSKRIEVYHAKSKKKFPQTKIMHLLKN